MAEIAASTVVLLAVMGALMLVKGLVKLFNKYVHIKKD